MEWQGKKFKEMLGQRKITQVAIASELGVSRQTVVDWINGQVPKGSHLLGICDRLDIDPDVLFDTSASPVQVAPMHRQRRNAKVTPEMRQAAEELALEYANLMDDASLPALEMVVRESANLTPAALAAQMRELAGLEHSHDPIGYRDTFRMVNELGICVVFRSFPEALKGYAFYTIVNGQRLVIVNSDSNLLDLIFPVLHETVHAARNRIPKADYAKAEEAFCDQVAGLIQFPDSYVDDVYDAIKGRPAASQINTLKDFARRHHHAIYGLVRRIEERHGKLNLSSQSVNGADGNLRKECPTIKEVLVSDGAPGFVELLSELSPIWSRIVIGNLESMTTGKLAEVLDLGILDARAVREELHQRGEMQACDCCV